jgi:Ca-activated chloride channel family protein
MYNQRILQSLFILFSFVFISAQATSYQGTKIVDVLQRFQQQGMKINYSSRLVPDDLVVLQEPRSSSPRDILDEILNPHGLRIVEGPEKIYLVVKRSGQQLKTAAYYGSPSSVAEHVDVPFVTIYVTVEGLNGRFITTLKPKDFIVKEDGAEQTISEFTNLSASPDEHQPATVQLLIDQSLSMRDVHSSIRKYDFFRTATLKMLEQLQPQDEFLLSAFDQTFRPLTALTQDRALIRDQLRQDPELKTRTALLDILPQAVERMRNLPNRKILIICSDGQDTASHSSIDTAVHFLQSSDVTIFTIGTDTGPNSGTWGRYILEKISAATGGYSVFVPVKSDLNEAVHLIRLAMGSQYVFGYAPRYPNIHKWRDIRVECKMSGARLHYRNRYLF